MRRPAAVLALSLAFAPPAAAAPLADGVFEGKIAGALRARIHIVTEAGTRRATFDSPDQGASGIPLSIVRLDEDSLVVTLAAANARYSAALADGGRVLRGIWSQGAMAVPLDLARLESPPDDSRPQDPKPPFPYDAAEVSFRNPEQGHTLTGTLTTPRGPARRHAAVVLISGSGQQDRDSQFANHRPFRLLADQFTRAGFVVLRYDDRGVGGSGGEVLTATSADFATDAAAAVALVRSRPEVDPRRVFVLGHSEGGSIAMRLAARDERLAGIVLVAAPTVRGDSLTAEQSLALMRAAGRDADGIGRTMHLNRSLWRHMADDTPADTAVARAERTLRDLVAGWPAEERAALGDFERFVRTTSAQAALPWLRAFYRHDPATDLARVRIPVLALFGERDLQVVPAQNRPALERQFTGRRAALLGVHTMPGLNHMMQTATTGQPEEYARITETLAPAAMQLIVDWLGRHAGSKR